MSERVGLSTYHSPRRSSGRAYLASLILLFALLGCGLGSDATNTACMCGAPSIGVAALEFSATTSYQQALREVTDIGYQPTVQCGFAGDVAAGRVIEGLVWKPAGQLDRFNRTHVLWVVRTALASTGADESSILNTLDGVIQTTWQETMYCSNPDTRPADVAPTSSTPTVFTSSELNPVPYARVTFAPSVDYDTALAAISDLGVRLGDYCYETGLEAFNHGKAPWQPMGQESSFASTHTLTIAATPLTTALTWLDQLSALPGVTGIQPNYTPTC